MYVRIWLIKHICESAAFLSDFLKGEICGKVPSAEESEFINASL